MSFKSESHQIYQHRINMQSAWHKPGMWNWTYKDHFNSIGSTTCVKIIQQGLVFNNFYLYIAWGIDSHHFLCAAFERQNLRKLITTQFWPAFVTICNFSDFCHFIATRYLLTVQVEVKSKKQDKEYLDGWGNKLITEFGEDGDGMDERAASDNQGFQNYAVCGISWHHGGCLDLLPSWVS